MEEKKDKYPLRKSRICFGLSLLFFSLICLISPTTKFWVFDFVPVYLFGLMANYLFFPFLCLYSIYLVFKDKIKKYFTFKHRFFPVLLLFIAILMIVSHACLGGKESFQTTSLFQDGFDLAIKNQGSGFYTIKELGGGIIGYFLAAMMMLFNQSWVVILVGVLLILISLIWLFFPLIKKGFAFIRGKRQISKAKDSLEEEESLEEKEEIPTESNDEEAVSLPKLQMDVSYKEEEQPIQTRVELYREEETVQPNKIEAEPTTFVPNEEDFAQNNTFGLRQATFSLGGDTSPNKEEIHVEENKPIIEEKEETPIEENIVEDVKPSLEEEEKIVFDIDEGKEIEEESPAEQSFVEEEITEDIKEKPIEENNFVPHNLDIPEEEAPTIIVKNEENDEEYEKARLEAEEKRRKEEEEANDYVYFGQYKIRKQHPLPPYNPPTSDMLKVYPPDENAAANEEKCKERSQIIDQTLANLGIRAHVESYTIGPSVTRFSIKTDLDVKVETLTTAMNTVMVRLGGVLGLFQDVVQGSDCSGLEVPNEHQALVSYKETLEAMPVGEKYNLYIPFGKSIEGKIVSADLSKFPHMLVAGGTGSGKSVFMNGILTSLIIRNRPEELRIVLVDPKRVEFAKYDAIPHLLCPVVKEPTHAKIALDKLVEEMERRYRIFENAGVSSIREFNKDITEEKGCEKLPFIVCAIDEYADLKDTCKDIDDPVVRLAQKARAAGIHLIVATQRPTVDVIGGRIKANIATSVALKVKNAQDSTIILGHKGAETLIGYGDMLVDCGEISTMGFTRLQGCFIENSEIRKVMESIRSQLPLNYDPAFLDLEDHSKEVNNAPSIDAPTAAQIKAAADEEKYQLIKEVVMTREYTSISQIQREFQTGFNKAGKIFERLKAEGIVGQADSQSSNKGSPVLIHSAPKIQSANPGSTSTSTLTPEGYPTRGE